MDWCVKKGQSINSPITYEKEEEEVTFFLIDFHDPNMSIDFARLNCLCVWECVDNWGCRSKGEWGNEGEDGTAGSRKGKEGKSGRESLPGRETDGRNSAARNNTTGSQAGRGNYVPLCEPDPGSLGRGIDTPRLPHAQNLSDDDDDDDDFVAWRQSKLEANIFRPRGGDWLLSYFAWLCLLLFSTIKGASG